ncbi:MAG: ATP-binding protein [Dehalococcoidia bacterium]|nr:ATP-binding protein [Dehalococcoidia bacterium]
MSNSKANSRPCGLVILSGLPGAGKTTFARNLAERLPHVHIESDAIRRAFAAQPAYTPPEHARVFRSAERQAATALRKGETVVVDATNLTAKDRRRFLQLAARTGVPLVAVRIVAPEETIRERLARPRDGWSQADLGVYEMMRGRAQRFSVPVVVVDTRFPLGPSVELVARLLEEAATG